MPYANTQILPGYDQLAGQSSYASDDPNWWQNQIQGQDIYRDPETAASAQTMQQTPVAGGGSWWMKMISGAILGLIGGAGEEDAATGFAKGYTQVMAQRERDREIAVEARKAATQDRIQRSQLWNQRLEQIRLERQLSFLPEEEQMKQEQHSLDKIKMWQSMGLPFEGSFDDNDENAYNAKMDQLKSEGRDLTDVVFEKVGGKRWVFTNDPQRNVYPNNAPPSQIGDYTISRANRSIDDVATEEYRYRALEQDRIQGEAQLEVQKQQAESYRQSLLQREPGTTTEEQHLRDKANHWSNAVIELKQSLYEPFDRMKWQPQATKDMTAEQAFQRYKDTVVSTAIPRSEAEYNQTRLELSKMPGEEPFVPEPGTHIFAGGRLMLVTELKDGKPVVIDPAKITAAEAKVSQLMSKQKGVTFEGAAKALASKEGWSIGLLRAVLLRAQ